LLQELLANRFSEVIVDEAQDCGVEDLAVLNALREVNVDLTLGADLDQAIFEFRRAIPDDVRKFAGQLPQGKRLNGNFRSSPAICTMNDSLRTSGLKDVAIGPYSCDDLSVQLLTYEQPCEVGARVLRLGNAHGIDAAEMIVLAHRSADARLHAGASNPGTGKRGGSVGIVAASGVKLRDPSTEASARLRAVEEVERCLLSLVEGIDLTTRAVTAACEAIGLDHRWLRDVAVRLAVGIDPGSASPREYAQRLRQAVEQLVWPTRIDLRKLGPQLRSPTAADWAAITADQTAGSLAWSTIHAVKGKQFLAVRLVLPKALVTDDDGATVLDHWEAGVNSEPRRVLYVGASRAQRLLILAVHEEHAARVKGLLERDAVPFATTGTRLAI
jgi:DNA helicase-2/ATP-dependent DNA helicase PcrA